MIYALPEEESVMKREEVVSHLKTFDPEIYNLLEEANASGTPSPSCRT